VPEVEPDEEPEELPAELPAVPPGIDDPFVLPWPAHPITTIAPMAVNRAHFFKSRSPQKYGHLHCRTPVYNALACLSSRRVNRVV